MRQHTAPTIRFLGPPVRPRPLIPYTKSLTGDLSGNWPSQWHASARGFFDSRGHLKAEAIGEARQMVENPDDVSDFERFAA
jgi:hypothetical protein